ncbi:hypothetical protein KIV10_06715 [Aequorivita echinoideorum]|uniref:Secreted protein n=2 Tax=Aequorivita echinoideorum TaxID=1549647 RepID=A0ABS5S3T4_9FLAO|nr:hypothetical protein [Aequorivita echinoideorum]
MLPLVAMLAFLISCNDKVEKEATPAGPTEFTLEQNKAALEQVSPSANSASSTTQDGLNPPHGQPGHRCDIAVGAPLNGGNAQQAQSQTPATNTTTNSNVNPPHGQPGHRCDIAVGAPL